MTIRRVLETSLYCDDLAATAKFYREVLGLGVHFSDPRLVALDASGSTVLLLFARGASRNGIALPEGTIPGHDGSGPAHVALAVDADELDAWETRLAAAGVAIESLVRDQAGGGLLGRVGCGSLGRPELIGKPGVLAFSHESDDLQKGRASVLLLFKGRAEAARPRSGSAR